jgi:two-component system sensor histidine kinase YesM
VVSALMIVLFSKSFSLRVNYFSRQMQKAATGDFKLAEILKGNDEISTLYEYLNIMISSIQSLITEVYEEQLQKERLKTRQRDAEFKMLASQINPHFLYNTLETIRMKARASGESDIEELVKMLAKILRNSVQVGNGEVTITSEIKFLVYYLKIQQYRFGERIQYHINIEKELENKLILPLIMQPIVENSIVHGLESKEGIGNITIKISKKDESNISILVEDDGLGIESNKLEDIIHSLDDFETIKTTHIGISNVHQRVRLHYGELYGIQLSSEIGVGTRVVIIIPNILSN